VSDVHAVADAADAVGDVDTGVEGDRGCSRTGRSKRVLAK
jgi:hypothetical protein